MRQFSRGGPWRPPFPKKALQELRYNESETHTAVRLDFPLHRETSIVHSQISATRLKQVIGKELGNETSLKETLVCREASL